MLTARGELLDRIVGLELGADDYPPKPFEPRDCWRASRRCRWPRRNPPRTTPRFGRLDRPRRARRLPRRQGAELTGTSSTCSSFWRKPAAC
jgi:OmpR family response regulator RpaB